MVSRHEIGMPTQLYHEGQDIRHYANQPACPL